MSKKQYEEKQKHGTLELPVAVHKMSYPQGTDAIFYLHWHQEFEFLIVTQGTIRFHIEDREYLLHTGEGVFINSNFLHSAWAVDGQPCSFLAVDFRYEFLHEDIQSRFAKRYMRPVMDGRVIFPELISMQKPEDYGRWQVPAPEEPAGSGQAGVPGQWQMRLLEMIRELQVCWEHDMEPFELLLKSHVLGAWDLLERHSLRVKSRDEDGSTGRLEPVISYIKQNYAEEISLADLAGILPMSEGQFCRVFKQKMKMSPMQYLMRYRILQSCLLLQDTDDKIGEIANLCGFNNISYFNKVFLQIIGCTPKEYRANSNYQG